MFTGHLAKAIKRYKYDGSRGWAMVFGRLLIGHLRAHRSSMEEFDLIIASPAYVGRGGRSWDHTRLVLQSADAETHGEWPFDMNEPAAIVKTARTEPLAGKPWKRRKLIVDSEIYPTLSIPFRTRTAGKRILVFDDVFTDGLQMNAIAEVLRCEGGAASVSGLVLARAPYRG